jgi:predicted nucleotidyltransferase component of viral defense system
MGNFGQARGSMVDFSLHAITQSCQRCLTFLSPKDFIRDFYLAGGTALALQIGHRISTDLDWFSTSQPLVSSERESICQIMRESKDFELVSEQDGLLFTRLFQTDVSFICKHHSLVEQTVDFHGVRLASPTDIGLMKLAAINSRGSRRDFIDLYCLREFISLDRLLELAPSKYRDRPSFLSVAARALAYFEEAEAQPMPRMLISIQWPDVRHYCEAASRKLTRRLSGLEP